MKKTLALLSLTLVTAFMHPMVSVVAQIPQIPPPFTVPTLPPSFPDLPTDEPSPSTPTPTPPPSTNQGPLRLIELEMNCTPRHACLGWDEQIFWRRGQKGDRKALLDSIDNSLRYLETNGAKQAYENYQIKDFTVERVRRSLVRFRELVATSRSAAQLQNSVRREFAVYKSVGNDGNGTVKFTAYYEPIYTASAVRTAEYKYPIFRTPPDFDNWAKPHPKRVDLEGADGLGADRSQLRGLELFWFRDRFDAYMIQIQGSATLKLTDGRTTSVGYGGATDYPWTSIGKELLKDGKVGKEKLSLPGIITFFKENPQEMNTYLPRWERFVFFKQRNGASATGSINVPVTAERSIATDKSLMPRGALAVVNASFPYPAPGGGLQYRRVSRFVLDQDTGSAIKGPGRVDYFMGTGQLAGDRAGVTGGNGGLYYLLLKQ
jgi:membrane-bound lytic murein transglycosylase A